VIRTLLVPVDESIEAERSVLVAAAVARSTRAVVELVTVDSPHVETDEVRRYHERLTEGPLRGVTVHGTVVLTDDPVADVLVRLRSATAGGLLCLSTRAPGPLGEAVVGSVGEAVLHRSQDPVLFVGPALRPSPAAPVRVTGPVVVALEGDEQDRPVIEAAIDWAAATGSELHFTHVVTAPDAPDARSGTRSLLARSVEDAGQRGVVALAEPVDAGDAGTGLLRLLRTTPAGILVVGSHRRGVIGRLAFGTHAEWLVRRAPCPVLVAGTPGP